MFYLNPDAPSHPGGPDPNFNGWVYLAYDYRHLDHTKIGITTRPLFKRIRESTTNPWYVRISANVTADFGMVTDLAGFGVARC